MKSKIVRIKHVTGIYKLDIEDGKIEDMKEHIDLCLKAEQTGIIVTAENGDTFYYPAELLRNSVISIEDKVEVTVF
ncbi:glyceraldehyde-3-phosphate dehydrogenase [uncultured Chryseobacterium sp.]|uniref:glyceraldehyde-3-phosphate dehydrogenase n=1 Tax=uncultured Chryseobacterium sp. TaxID=259322 RepID=UPI002589F1F4|nr:glyceraldehyde-3-phosphate dehydrogenase [uncultured Chryseobacterium sp.]